MLHLIKAHVIYVSLGPRGLFSGLGACGHKEYDPATSYKRTLQLIPGVFDSGSMGWVGYEIGEAIRVASLDVPVGILLFSS